MSSLRSIELGLIDEIFRGGDRGYILDFSNRTFSEFFVRELNVDINAPDYATGGTSKGKRLRTFLSTVDDGTAARTLRALCEYQEAQRLRSGSSPSPHKSAQITSLIAKLEGQASPVPINVINAPKLDVIDFGRMTERLISIRDMRPHERGYAFEKFLCDLFDAFRLKAREPFRINGEQIDGSFELLNEIYLVEAKWINRPIGQAELHTFHGKLDQKAYWTRGLFISFNGFTTEGLIAFGRGKRVICVDGRDLYQALTRCIGIDDLLARKVRRASESGDVFTPIDALFPA
ncbi:restriction endonuclease [Gluconobacter cerinus]|uniref:restriction endonuclease n=1 Tax=Gluconobacter cerinus TaxID=38307 RepID=UPI001B8CCC57|nr:restriction endonuclease [Gluconobacter cerinus]MBS1019413.1 restriction endonuclease [Gluconobacter cerinus]